MTATGSVRGAAHAHRGAPNEDAADTTDDGVLAIAVADGHGTDQCPRAVTGAAFAVNAVLATGRAIAHGADPAQLADDLTRRWDDAVHADLSTTPPSTQEAALGPPRRLYGTTALGAALLPDDTLVLCQLGDGDVVVGLTGGELLRPFPPIDLQVPGRTNSLAQVAAAAHVRTHTIPDAAARVDLVLLATDGLSDAYAEPDWHEEVVADLRARLRGTDPAGLASAITGWCQAPAAIGGDDTTIALLAAADLFG